MRAYRPPAASSSSWVPCSATRPSSQDDDAVGVAHRGQAVGDHEHRAPPRQLGERLLDERLVLGIGEGRRLVEHHHVGVLQDGPRQHEALHLAAGKVRSAGAVRGVHAVRKLGHDVVALRRAQRRHDLPARRIGPRGADVLKNRLLEQPVRLKHERHPVHEVVRVHLAHVHPAHKHAPAVGVPEPGHQACRRGLAAARGAHERHGRARRHLEAHVGERGRVRPLVGEAHIVEHDGVAVRCLGVLGRGDHGSCKDVLDAGNGVGGRLRGLGHEHHARHRGRDDRREDGIEREVCQKRSEIPLAGSQQDGGRHQEQRHAVDEGEGERLRHLAPLDSVVLRQYGELPYRVVEGLERVDGLLEHLHDGDPAHVLGPRLVHFDERLHVPGHELHAASAHHAGHAAYREDYRSEAGKAQPPVEREEQREHANDHGDRPRRVGQLVREKPLRLRRAPVDHAPERPRRVRVEVPERRVHQALDGALAHVRRATERRQVRAHETGEIQGDAERAERERPPPVRGDPCRSAPVRRRRDQVARHQPDAHVRAEARQHRGGGQGAAQVRKGLARPCEVEQSRHSPSLLGRNVFLHGHLRIACLRARSPETDPVVHRPRLIVRFR